MNLSIVGRGEPSPEMCRYYEGSRTLRNIPWVPLSNQRRGFGPIATEKHVSTHSLEVAYQNACPKFDTTSCIISKPLIPEATDSMV